MNIHKKIEISTLLLSSKYRAIYCHSLKSYTYSLQKYHQLNRDHPRSETDSAWCRFFANFVINITCFIQNLYSLTNKKLKLNK